MKKLVVKVDLIGGLKNCIPGDTGGSSSPGWLSSSIRFFERMQTGAADRSHTFGVIDNHQSGVVKILESLVRVRINKIEKYENQDIEIWRFPLTKAERDRISEFASLHAGDGYSWGGIMFFALDSTLTGMKKLISFGKWKKPVTIFTKHLTLLPIKVCSQFWMGKVIYGLTSYRLLDENHVVVDPDTMSPDRIQDLCHFPHNKAQLVYKQTYE